MVQEGDERVRESMGEGMWMLQQTGLGGEEVLGRRRERLNCGGYFNV